MSLISREVWWFQPPKPGQTEADLKWGFLEIYSDRTAAFIDERPTPEQLATRKSCRYFPAEDEPE
ncbi:hypothetical protein [Pseudomonas fontis]|uniref:Uncharacterized protein n=1 Tax=Pseudomonas fontis TaxID=2942633 RepID=A0ABT5NPI2_9PSED|nr:hypothetical protein [Pseudomonas fontis]MDD0973742.1 hypothetical protein [Pseudomonas fontis]MDD0990044.1 hypothetical protein [Pseudomonas fontis]